MWGSSEGRTLGSRCSAESSARPRPGSNAKRLTVRISRMAEEEITMGSSLSDASSVRNCHTGLLRHIVCTTIDIDDDVLRAVKGLARREKTTAGAIISALTQKALNAPTATVERHLRRAGDI